MKLARKKLGVKEEDKIPFIEKAGKIEMLNSSMAALKEAQRAFRGAAREAGVKNKDDVIKMVRDMRRES